MSSPTQDRPVVTLYPSPQERVNSYMAAIRLASSLHDSMNAQKAGVDIEKTAPLADSYGRHHPNVPPQPSAKSAANGGPKPYLILNQTASAHFAPNTTKSGFVHPRNGNPSPSHSKSTAITREGVKRHQGYFPPPVPPTTAGEDNKRELAKQHNGYFPPPDPPMPTIDDWTPEDTMATHLPPNEIPPGCHIHLAQTDSVLALTVCPATKRTTNLATDHLRTDSIFNSHILTPRDDTSACEAPTTFDQHLACAGPKLAFSLVTLIFLLFSLLLCLTRRKHLRRSRQKQQQLDVEKTANATWPRPSTQSFFESQRTPRRMAEGPRPTDISSETKLRDEIRTCMREYRRRLDEGVVGAERCEPVAWRGASCCAERAGAGGRVERDAGPVAALPGLN